MDTVSRMAKLRRSLWMQRKSQEKQDKYTRGRDLENREWRFWAGGMMRASGVIEPRDRGH